MPKTPTKTAGTIEAIVIRKEVIKKKEHIEYWTRRSGWVADQKDADNMDEEAATALVRELTAKCRRKGYTFDHRII